MISPTYPERTKRVRCLTRFTPRVLSDRERNSSVTTKSDQTKPGQTNSNQEAIGRAENAVNTNSRPSDLRITDIRLAVVASNYDYPILRIDTNQGVYGIGEVRDAGHRENALQFKSILVGQNPCNSDMIFRAIK